MNMKMLEELYVVCKKLQSKTYTQNTITKLYLNRISVMMHSILRVENVPANCAALVMQSHFAFDAG